MSFDDIMEHSLSIINQRYIYLYRQYGKTSFYHYYDENFIEIVREIEFKRIYKEVIESKYMILPYKFKREDIERMQINGIKQLPK